MPTRLQWSLGTQRSNLSESAATEWLWRVASHGCTLLSAKIENHRMQRELPEHLLSEVCLGAVIDVASALLWMKSTFLFGIIHPPIPPLVHSEVLWPSGFVGSSIEVD